MAAGAERKLGRVATPNQGILKIPGFIPSSAIKTQELCQRNHDRFHWAMNSKGFHNHLNHHVLAAYSIGASPERLDAIFNERAKEQRAIPNNDLQITPDNFCNHLQTQSAYTAYLAYFVGEIDKHGISATLQKYGFSDNGSQLFQRFFAGVLHPMIETGYGLEFNLGALVAEGLAQGCAHRPTTSALFEPGFLPSANLNAKVDSAAISGESFEVACEKRDRTQTYKPNTGITALDVANNILCDDSLDPNAKDLPHVLDELLEVKGERIRKHCEKWEIDVGASFDEIAAKAEELMVLAVIVYASATPSGNSPNLDFFSMHSVTSSMFIPSFLRYLSRENQVRLLHAHFRVQIAQWIARGRPKLHIRDTLMALPHNLSGEDPWAPIIDSALQHEDEHLVKTLRTLCYESAHFGSTRRGYWACTLPESELVDGTIFAMAAKVSLDTLGWNETKGSWSFDGFWSKSKL